MGLILTLTFDFVFFWGGVGEGGLSTPVAIFGFCLFMVFVTIFWSTISKLKG